MLAIIVGPDGAQRRVCVGANTVQVIAPDDAYVTANFNAEPTPSQYRWDAAACVEEMQGGNTDVTAAYVALPGAPTYTISRTKLSKREFLNRVTKTTLGQINAIILTPITNAAVQVPIIAQLVTMKDYLNAVPDVELDHPDTISFCEGLVLLGLKTEAEKTAMLTPSTVASE